jgi:UDP-N-acetylglucosamine--N-acetylmuramyl-(pentapeptide) pyrophosphoryl-undecaprenol N-acetylglucosamine transferase
LNETVLLALPFLEKGIRIVHQTGDAMRETVARGYASLGRDAEVVSFLDDMEARFVEADVVVCRSGATTCAELTSAGKVAVLVPFAKAADDHQRVNAKALESAGAAVVLEEASLSGKTLAETIEGLFSSPERLREMEHASARLGRPDAARDVAALLVEER